MQHCTCGCAARWCARADALFRVPGFHVVEVIERPADRVARVRRLELVVETDDEAVGCPNCGVVAVRHGRREHTAADAPCFGVPITIRWRKRLWRCPELVCPTVTFSEQHPFVPARAKLTTRAVTWATDALEHDDTTVAALARHLGVDWHTCWDAVEREAARRLARPGRLAGVRAVGVDEHIWRPSKVGANDRAVTGVVDLTRDQHGNLHARLLDVVVGRSGTAYAAWLQQQTQEFIDALLTQDLLVDNRANATLANGERLTLGGFKVIDEERFKAVPAVVLETWRNQGWLAWVYAHFFSLTGWNGLAALASKRPPAVEVTTRRG